ncbi:TPA: hypothetical protein EYP70_02630, partial [Candidatus Bathyarchaeota archaeon]|nr:hypothetical protein [Candidatus Bathyarchaeota archaeon]
MRLKGRLLLHLDLIFVSALSALISMLLLQSPPVEAAEKTYYMIFASILVGSAMSVTILILKAAIIEGEWRRIQYRIRRRLKSASIQRYPQIKVWRVNEGFKDLPLTFISKRSFLRGIAEKLSLQLSGDILRAGRTISPYRIAAKSLFYSIISALIAVPAGIILLLKIHPAFIAVVTIPFITLVYPKIRLKSLIGDRKRSLEDEVPFFTVYASIMQSVGLSLYNSLTSIIGREIFPQVEKDAMIAKRNVEFFYKSPVEALEDLGRIHPNEKMKGLLLGYTSEWRSGGDMARYLEAKAEDFLAEMKFRWRSYGERASDIGEAVTSLLFVFPMIILMSAFIAPAHASTLLGVLVSAGIPLLTAITFGIIHMIQPKSYDKIDGNLPLSLASATTLFLATYLFGAPFWFCFSAAFAGGAAAYGGSVLLQLRNIRLLEGFLPAFLRDVTEYKKMGYDVNRAILKLSRQCSYSPVLNETLRIVARQVELGVRIVEAKVPTRSWIAKICFFLLSMVVESGGGTARCLETLTDFVTTI